MDYEAFNFSKRKDRNEVPDLILKRCKTDENSPIFVNFKNKNYEYMR